MSKWTTCILADDNTDTAAVRRSERVLIAALKHIACTVEALLVTILAALYLVPMAYKERGYWAIGGEWLGIVLIFCATYFVRFMIKEE